MNSVKPFKTQLKIYGVTVQVTSNEAQIIEWLEFDFSIYKNDHTNSTSTSVKINVVSGEIPKDLIPQLVESVHAPEYVAYDSGGIRYVNYYDRAAVVFEMKNEHAEFYGNDLAFLFEKLYLFILSRVGEILDRLGIHRIHALGFTYAGKAGLLLVPMHGGKSTMGAALLATEGVKLIADDTPLIARSGKALPFAVRFGYRADDSAPKMIPQEFTRMVNRDKWGLKMLVSAEFYRDKLEQNPTKVNYVVIGKWLNGDKPKLEKLNKIRAFKYFVRDCVFGLGLPQVVEYFLLGGRKDFCRKTSIALRRSVASLSVVRNADTYTLLMSRNTEKNKELLLSLFSESS